MYCCICRSDDGGIGVTGNFYLFWLLLVTVAFLYNAAAGPLRTAFSPAPIYNVTGVYPASAAESATGSTDDNVDNSTEPCISGNVTSSNFTGDGTR